MIEIEHPTPETDFYIASSYYELTKFVDRFRGNWLQFGSPRNILNHIREVRGDEIISSPPLKPLEKGEDNFSRRGEISFALTVGLNRDGLDDALWPEYKLYVEYLTYHGTVGRMAVSWEVIEKDEFFVTRDSMTYASDRGTPLERKNWYKEKFGGRGLLREVKIGRVVRGGQWGPEHGKTFIYGDRTAERAYEQLKQYLQIISAKDWRRTD